MFLIHLSIWIPGFQPFNDYTRSGVRKMQQYSSAVLQQGHGALDTSDDALRKF